MEVASWRGWDVLVNLSPRTYSTAVQDAGAMALLLPPDDETAAEPDEALELVDGLVLAGGSDIDPATYGARPGEHTQGTWPERDRFELALAHRALERDIPLLGICRGMQMLNVALGGTLDQHVPDSVGNDDHRGPPGSFVDHDVRLEPGSLAARVEGSETISVKSCHHQGIAELGEGLRITGRAAGDDLPEAVELADRHVLGVLWHPEEDESSRLVAALVEEARP
jgi:putative glutamine amidotransferase